MSAVTVNIKMYRVGELGDCFYLRFQNEKDYTNVLIDCGSFRNSQKSIDRMNKIAEDIKSQLGTEKMHVVIGTHQHNDHLSGFVHAKDIFDSMNIEQVWLSWLDNPNDQQATKIGKQYNNLLTNLRHISNRLGMQWFTSNSAAKKTKQRIDNVLGFFGINDVPSAKKKDKFPPELPAEAIKILRELGTKKASYLSPGDMLNLPGLPAGLVKVYVLGPPKNEALLKDPNPGREETYDPELSVNNAQAEKLLLALNNLTGNDAAGNNEGQPYPFDEPYADTENFDSVWNVQKKNGDKLMKTG